MAKTLNGDVMDIRKEKESGITCVSKGRSELKVGWIKGNQTASLVFSINIKGKIVQIAKCQKKRKLKYFQGKK